MFACDLNFKQRTDILFVSFWIVKGWEDKKKLFAEQNLPQEFKNKIIINQGRSYLYARYARAYLKKSRVKTIKWNKILKKVWLKKKA